jgi:CrcB protein
MKMFFIVGLGSFLGGGFRYLIQKQLTDSIQSSFPYSTLLINITGCFFLGFILGISNKYDFLSPETRIFLTTGLCGGFTTFSTFSNDSLMLLRDGNYYYFLLYALLSVVVGIICTFLGYLIFK